jgi:hypothetical protein
MAFVYAAAARGNRWRGIVALVSADFYGAPVKPDERICNKVSAFVANYKLA